MSSFVVRTPVRQPGTCVPTTNPVRRCERRAFSNLSFLISNPHVSVLLCSAIQ